MKSKLNSDKNIGTVGQVLVLDDDDNLCWIDETEEEKNDFKYYERDQNSLQDVFEKTNPKCSICLKSINYDNDFYCKAKLYGEVTAWFHKHCKEQE